MSIRSEADVAAPPPADAPAHSVKASTGVKRRIRRRVAKTLAWISVALTAVMVLSEPWLLLPVITLAVALSLWD